MKRVCADHMSRGRPVLSARRWLDVHPKVFRIYRSYCLFRENRFRTLTAPLRSLPGFVIIGAAKSGTTTLYDLLVKHPYIKPALVKEPAFFSSPERPNVMHYTSKFPIRGNHTTCEASTGYLPSEYAPARMKAVIPHAKIIAILRNPIDRAYSHYTFARSRGVENAPTFEDALELEESRHAAYVSAARMMSSVSFDGAHLPDGVGMYQLARECLDHSWCSYLRYGHYAEHLENWFKHYDRSQTCVISLDDFRRDRQGVMDRTFDFLGVEPYDVSAFENKNVGRYDQTMSDRTHMELTEYFRPHNERLYRLLGRDFNWD